MEQAFEFIADHLITWAIIAGCAFAFGLTLDAMKRPATRDSMHAADPYYAIAVSGVVAGTFLTLLACVIRLFTVY